MFLAPLFAVPILLLGINPASACWRGYAYGYGGYGYATIDPLIHWPTARPMPMPVAVGVASAGGSGEQAVTATAMLRVASMVLAARRGIGNAHDV